MRPGPSFHCLSDRGPRPPKRRTAGWFLPQQTRADGMLEENMTEPTVDLLDVEGVLVEFVLEDQLLQVVEGLLVNSLSDNTACQCR